MTVSGERVFEAAKELRGGLRARCAVCCERLIKELLRASRHVRHVLGQGRKTPRQDGWSPILG